MHCAFVLFVASVFPHLILLCDIRRTHASAQSMKVLQLENHSLKIQDIINLASVWLKNAIHMFYSTVCFLCCPHQELLHTEADSNDPVLLRRKRMAQAEKNTCQLFIQTDHLFYKYYKTREAVIAQVTHTVY